MQDGLAATMLRLVIDLNTITTEYESTTTGLLKNCESKLIAGQRELEQSESACNAKKGQLALTRTATAEKAKKLSTESEGYQDRASNHLAQRSVTTEHRLLQLGRYAGSHESFGLAEQWLAHARDSLARLCSIEKPKNQASLFGGLCIPGFVISICASCAAGNAANQAGVAILSFVAINCLFLGLATVIAILRYTSATSLMKSGHQSLLAAASEAQAHISAALEHADEQYAHEFNKAENTVGQAHAQYRDVEQRARAQFEQGVLNFRDRFVPQVDRLKEQFAAFYLATGFVGMNWWEDGWSQWVPATAPALFACLGTLKSRRVEMLKPYFDDSLLDLSIPALAALASGDGGRSVLLKCAGPPKEVAARAVQAVVMRLLATIPPGKVKFTFVDPVGLGQNANSFMQLGDYEESMVSGKAWTEPQHIEQELLQLSEHMETVIQKYLRNDYDSIEQYNENAGEVAEAYRVLVVWDFPVNFTDTSARRLVSIAENGPRCGVFTIVLMDTSAEKRLPYGFTLGDLERSSNLIEYNSGKFVWLNEHCKQHEVVMAEPPTADLSKQVIGRIGSLAKSALNVQVPFSKLLIKANLGDGNWWKKSTENTLEAPLGPHGANKIQSLTLGEKTAHHAIVVGRTGSGKSNLMHVIITSLALSYAPDQIELYMIDFKQGVEFKQYALAKLPHAKVIAIESEREFGISVLQGLDAELHKRGELFRASNVSSITNYRKSVGPMPRILLLVDEFQEFFSQEDAISSQARLILDRLVRQGRSQGMHIMLGSQTLAGGSDLPHSVISQMGVRIALQCTEGDARQIMGDDNLVNRQLSRPGEAIYNPESGQVEANRLFQVAMFTDQDRDMYLDKIAELTRNAESSFSPPIIFEGNEPARIESCLLLAEVAETEPEQNAIKVAQAWLGEPIAIRPPVAAKLRRQGCSNLLIVTRDEQQGIGTLLAALLSLLAQYSVERAEFFIVNLTTADSDWNELPDLISGIFPHNIQLVKRANLGAVLENLAMRAQERAAEEKSGSSEDFLLFLGLHRVRDFRDDNDGISSLFKDEAERNADPKLLFTKVLREGPESGIHVIAWCDSYANLGRIDRRLLAEFGMRVAGPMSNDDSQHLIDDALASKLDRPHRAIFFDEEQPGRLEKFRPYAIPDAGWLRTFASKLQAKYRKSQEASGG